MSITLFLTRNIDNLKFCIRCDPGEQAGQGEKAFWMLWRAQEKQLINYLTLS